MNKKLLVFFPVLVLIALINMATSSGRADGANQGNTGAPGDNSRTCVNCHNNGNIDVDVKMRLLNASGDEVNQYKPGERYTVEVLIDSLDGPAARGFGFQLVCLDAPLDQNGDDLENWLDNGMNNYKISEARGRSYAEHAGVSRTNLFEVEWMAPEANTGTVSFYTSGNGVNFNGGTSGDGADVAKMEITEDQTSSTRDHWKNNIRVIPNPTDGKSSINLPESFQGSVNVFNMIGQKIQTIELNERVGEVDLTSFQSGIYLLQFDHRDGNSKAVRLLKN